LYAREGAKVIVVDYRLNSAEDTCQLIAKEGGLRVAGRPPPQTQQQNVQPRDAKYVARFEGLPSQFDCSNEPYNQRNTIQMERMRRYRWNA
jgi:hypothetical protein